MPVLPFEMCFICCAEEICFVVCVLGFFMDCLDLFVCLVFCMRESLYYMLTLTKIKLSVFFIMKEFGGLGENFFIGWVGLFVFPLQLCKSVQKSKMLEKMLRSGSPARG